MTAPFISSVRVEKSSGPHEYVSVWIRGQSVGTLCVGDGDGDGEGEGCGRCCSTTQGRP